MEPTSKLEDLKIKKEYIMMQTQEINSEYGRTTCIFKSVHDTYKIGYEFRRLTDHINKLNLVENPKSPFEFTVKVRENIIRTGNAINTKYGKDYILQDVDEYTEYYFYRLTDHINELDLVENPTSPFEFTVKVWKIGNSMLPKIL